MAQESKIFPQYILFLFFHISFNSFGLSCFFSALLLKVFFTHLLKFCLAHTTGSYYSILLHDYLQALARKEPTANVKDDFLPETREFVNDFFRAAARQDQKLNIQSVDFLSEI